MTKDWIGTLRAQEQIGPDLYAAVVECSPVARQAQPGQFVLVSPGDRSLRLLRPLGISGTSGDMFEMIYRKVGRGTELMTRWQPGTEFLFRGPAGGAFSRPTGPAIAVAGTLGVAPLLFARQVFGPFEKMFLGVPNGSWEPFARWVAGRAGETELYCDTGEIGLKGFCTQGLDGLDLSGRSVLACGPNPMLAALYRRWGGTVSDMQVSLEKRMGCGMGGCFGCVVSLKTGRRRLCIDGPVFQAKEVDWDELHL